MRRLVLPLVLLLVATGAGWQAFRVDRTLDVEAVAATLPGLEARTPVLSVRRAPRWLQRPTADSALVATMEQEAGTAPPETCVVVRDDRRPIYARNGADPLVPASTAKLVTAAAAVDVLGVDSRFRTTVLSREAPVSGVLAGDIWLVGGGDPVLATSAYAGRSREPRLFTDIDDLAAQLVGAGVVEIRGDVVGDESRYDRIRSVPTWDPVFIRDREAGPLSALSVNNGFASFPDGPSNRGAIPASDPAQQAAAVFRDVLQQRGVTVAGTVRSGIAPPDAGELASIESAPLRDIVGHVLTTSDNSAAELLVKEIGLAVAGAGSTDAGVAAARASLESAGIRTDGIVITDGSGLDRGGRLSCEVLAAVLDHAGPDSVLAEGLAVAGESGTLRTRWAGTAASGQIRAKTGSVRNSRALAGFARSRTGSALTFAVITNQEVLDAGLSLSLQQALALALVDYPQGPSVEQLGPRPAAVAGG